ncbi:tripeptidyl peptidase precursor [Moelleriella libera RCEF 2490]|uniref:tripeptidyl-peptidase II n=1 Tax=Moelleriella libera RCEF 2490 TaxID=1081109 RepID=A0A168EP57_9HYPO|nr:tripeptidyl peptidase precursor [Moelleriella libera RCEF 2490]
MAWRLIITALALASPGLSAVCLEKASTVPHRWKMLDRVPEPSTLMRFSIALRQPGIQDLTSKILSNSRLQTDDILAMRLPDKKDVENVMKWLGSNDIITAAVDHDWIHVSTTVEKANKLLDMHLRRYSFDDKAPILRTTEYNIPDELAGIIDFVHPIANFMTPEHEVSKATLLPRDQVLNQRDDPCFPQTRQDCLSKLYGINYVTPDNQSPIRFGITGFLEEWANYADLHDSFLQSRPDLIKAGYNFTVELLNGGENRQEFGTAGTEANLDIQFGMAVGYPTKVTYYSVGGRGVKLDDQGAPLKGELDDNEPYLDFLEYIARKPDDELPHVISMSYADDELSVPKPYAIRVCDLIGMLAARGVSILSGSGDGGSRGGRKAECRSNNGTNKDMTISTFPASCPWVTSVGAVNNVGDPPEGSVFSSGGFSSYFSRPEWQIEAVDTYVQALNGHLKGYYDPNMRAVPDISAVGTQFVTVVNGQMTILQGTSASTPVVAAMIALINDARVRKGKKTLGWLNGVLYSPKVREILQDITSGQSYSCVFSDGSAPGGWPAARGYDAITGLGVPSNFGKFMDVLAEV